MPTLTISPEFQITLPRQFRKWLGLTPGQKIHATLFDGRIELIPQQPMAEMRGFLSGLDSRVQREEGRT